MSNGNEKTNRSYIVQTVISKNGSWNNDFNGTPKMYEDQFFASDRALKYATRYLMEQLGKKVFIRDWIKGVIEPDDTTKSSSYKVLSKAELKQFILSETGKKFSEVFWEFEDIRHFGMLYDGLGIHGVAQVSQGIDLYGQGIVYSDDLTGRMVFETKANPEDTTRGMATREFLSEAHFAYGITVNPANVHFLQDVKGYEHCVYTDEDYQVLLECLEHGPINVKSTQKLNCYTGMMLRIEMTDGNKTLLGNLQGKMNIKPEKVDGKVVYDVAPLFKYLENKRSKAGTDIFEEIHISYESSEIILEGVPEKVGENCEVQAFMY